MTAARFPTLSARSLGREPFDLPADFEARRNVAVVAFRREQQRDVDTWMPLLLELEAADRGLRAYEIPTISRSWSPVRRFIDGGMTAGIPDRAARERTLTTYTNVGAVLAALGLRDTSQIATVLTDRGGTIAWMSTGPCTPQAARGLCAALAAQAPAA
ncbi:MAG TPA: hypothetical protein VMT10_00485 [Solirubrobacteraceae bacterium]|nr:hypothetical protein [Solirubrobacteraceae bacterium]